MSYEQKSRSCRQATLVPHRQEYIEVMWCLDYLPGLPQQCCIAEVLHVATSPAQDILATGVLRYLPEDTWDEEIHEVEFLENNSVRRHEDTNSDEDDSAEQVNRNPVTKWRPSLRKGTDSVPSDDEDWTRVNGKIQGTQMSRSVYESQQLQINALRSGYSALTVELEKVKKELLKHSLIVSKMIGANHESVQCSNAECVLGRLRHKLGLRMQAGLRSMSTGTTRLGKRASSDSNNILQVHTGDGIHVGLVKARVDCTLGQFESIARQIKTTAAPGTVVFSPEFSHTQLPLQCSATFRILFKTFLEVSYQIGVTSLSDMLEMARKCGTGRQGDILRVLGTYEFNKEDNSSAARIFLGTSCSVHEKHRTDVQASIVSDETVEKYPTLARVSRKWDIVDHRFLHQLKLEYSSDLALDDLASEIQAFSIKWKRATELGVRIWSKGMLNERTVFGSLEVCLPFIQVEGEQLCAEIGALAGDDEWEKLFRKTT